MPGSLFENEGDIFIGATERELLRECSPGGREPLCFKIPCFEMMVESEAET